MTSQLFAVCFDAIRPQRLARFWSTLLGWEPVGDPHDGVALLPRDDTGFRIRFSPTTQHKTVQNRMHFGWPPPTASSTSAFPARPAAVPKNAPNAPG